jgi:serine/threonine-protein kinase
MPITPAPQSCPQCGTSYGAGQQYCASCGFPVGNLGGRSDDRFVGKTLPGGYHILDLISVGGMGRVYRAEQSVLGRTVAVKIIHPHLLVDENSVLRFMTEARAASQLNHPNSIAVFDFGRTDDGQPYLVMEFLRGKDLAKVAYEEGPLAFARIIDVLCQVLTALGEAHDLGIIHRDLKPENIVLEPLRRGGDFVKVLDFGLAKLKADAALPSVTSPGIVCGTPDYMSPEQGRGDPIDGRSDLYAVGVILFQLLTGRLPFEAESPTQVVMMHLSIPVPDPRRVAPDRGIPAPIVDVTLKALAKDADRRYQDALEFADALKHALELAESRPPLARQSSPPASFVAGRVVTCPSCGSLVPFAKFCCECAAPLALVMSPPTEGASPPRLPLPLVGREDDLAWLHERRSACRSGLLGARVVGEHGVGKTRLVTEFLNRIEADGDLVVRSRPDPYWADVAYHSLRFMVRELGQLSDLDLERGTFEHASPEARRGLEEIFAGVARTGDPRTPTERRHQLAEALRWALRRSAEVAGGARVVIAVDELHRVDGPSRTAIADVLGEAPQVRALVVATHVTGFDSGWGAAHAARVLTGLPHTTASRLLKDVRGGDKLRVLGQESGRGVLPMLVEQLLRYSLEVGGEPPSRLADLIAHRVDLLEPSCRLVLQALAVLGDQTEHSALARVLPKSLELEDTLGNLERAGMVERSAARVSTAHPLLHEVVLASIPAAARRDLHSKALRTLERRSAPLEARALHAYHAQESFQALLLLEQVGERASQRGDTSAEVMALRRGLELARLEIARGELDDPLQAMLIFGRKLGSALTRAGDYADAEGVLRETLDIAGPTGPERARVLAALAHVSYGRQREDEALGYLDQAIDAARQSGAHELMTLFRSTRAVWAN